MRRKCIKCIPIGTQESDLCKYIKDCEKNPESYLWCNNNEFCNKCGVKKIKKRSNDSFSETYTLLEDCSLVEDSKSNMIGDLND